MHIVKIKNRQRFKVSITLNPKPSPKSNPWPFIDAAHSLSFPLAPCFC